MAVTNCKYTPFVVWVGESDDAWRCRATSFPKRMSGRMSGRKRRSQSTFKTRIGSTLAARRAGRYTAMAATAINISGTVPKATGSMARTL